MSHTVSLAAGVLPEIEPEVVAGAAAEAGYPFAGFTIEPERWNTRRTRALRDRVTSLGIGVMDVEPLWIPPGGAVSSENLRLVEIAGELGARHLLVVSREEDVSRNADALRRLCEAAEPLGLRVALEFLMISPVRTLSKAAEIVAACDHPAAGILVDALHLQRAGEGLSGITRLDAHLFPYAQLCDGRLDCEDRFEAYLEDAIDGRSAPGEGALPLDGILDALPDGCPLSLEVRSKRYRDAFPDPVDRAKAILQRTSAFLAERSQREGRR